MFSTLFKEHATGVSSNMFAPSVLPAYPVYVQRSIAHERNREGCFKGGQSGEPARATSKNKVAHRCSNGRCNGITQRSIGAHVVSAILFENDASSRLPKAFSNKCLAKCTPQISGRATRLHCAQVKYYKTPLFADYLHRQTLWKGTAP